MNPIITELDENEEEWDIESPFEEIYSTIFDNESGPEDDDSDEWSDDSTEKSWGSSFPQTKKRDASGHEHAADGRFGTGGASKTDDGDGDDSKPENKDKVNTKRSLSPAKATEILDKFPGAKKIRKTLAKAKGKLVDRYGAKTAAAIVASGQAISWGAFGVGLATGAPLYVPSVIAMVPAAALAELHHQLKGSKADQDLSEEEIEREARKLIKELEEQWEKEKPEDSEEKSWLKWDGIDINRWEHVIKLHPGLRTKDHELPESQKPIFDDSKMTARSIISSDNVDRDKEILIPRGCDLSAFQVYAPWFFNHQQIPWPIGSCKERAEDPSCPPSIDIGDRLVMATCYFNQDTPEAVIAYKLWKRGHLGATSVGFESDPQQCRVIQGREAEEKYGTPYVKIYDWWQLVEISIVGVPANRDALRTIAGKGRIDGERIPVSMKSWFDRFLVKPALHRTTEALGKAWEFTA